MRHCGTQRLETDRLILRKFMNEGTLRSSDRNNQGICDACYYGILRSER